MITFVAFWSLLISSIINQIGIVHCTAFVPNNSNDNDSLAWWKYMSIYNVYPKSFKDTNGDGIGDFNGITQNLQHFVDLGIDVIWLNPYFESPDADHGYDISNFTEVHPMFGTMDDFDRLISEMKKLGLKFMMDFVGNHASDQHVWFKKSVEKIEPYTDYFVWRDPKGYDENGKPIPPNNWLRVFGNTAWTWVDARKQFYYHAFSSHQPDLNLRNPLVVEELKNVLRFWLNKGIDGLRLDTPEHYFEDPQLRDEPYVTKEAELSKSIDNNDLIHIYTAHLDESYQLATEFRSLMENEYNSKDGLDRPMIVEEYSTSIDVIRKWMQYVHLVFNFQFQFLRPHFNATSLNKVANHWNGFISTYMTEDHDTRRIIPNLGIEYVDIMNVLITILPGNVCIYYGQEIGMTEVPLRPDQIVDNNYSTRTRDPVRTPMQWDDSLNAGFTTKHKPWLPVHPNYWSVNVKNEKNANISHYQVLKSLMKLRTTVTCKHGKFNSYVISEWVWAFTRTHANAETYVVVFNIGSETEMIDLSVIPDLPEYLNVVVPTINAGYESGDYVISKPKFKQSIVLRPKSGLVLSTNADQRKRPVSDESERYKSNGPPIVRSIFSVVSLITLFSITWSMFL